jgi:hypothetical protein
MKADKKLSIKVKSKTERRIMEDPELEMISEWNIKKILFALIVFILVIILPAYYFSSMDNSEKSPTLETKKTALHNSDLVKQTPVNKTVTENIAKSAVANITPEQVTVKQAAIKQKPEHISEKGVVSKTSTNQTSVVVPPKQAVKETKQEDIVVKKEQQSPAVSPSNLSVHINRAQLAQGVNKLEPFGDIELPILVDTTKAYPVTYFTEVINMQGDTVFHEWLHDSNSVFKRKINIRGNRWRVSTSKLFPYNSTGQWQVRIITLQGDVLNKIDFSVEKR